MSPMHLLKLEPYSPRKSLKLLVNILTWEGHIRNMLSPQTINPIVPNHYPSINPQRLP